VANPNGNYMEEECTYYHEQAISTLRCEKVVENQVEERKEEKIEVPQDLHWEEGKEVSTEASSTSTPILDTPRGQESSFSGLLNKQIVAIKVEKSMSIFLMLFQFMIPFQMRNCLRRLSVIYPDLRMVGITCLKVKFILFGPREEKIGASNLNLRVRKH
jgi:hypothetical protein